MEDGKYKETRVIFLPITSCLLTFLPEMPADNNMEEGSSIHAIFLRDKSISCIPSLPQ